MTERSSRFKSSRLDPRIAAEALGIRALAFLASEPDRMGAFLAESGIGPEAIREAAREPHFLAGVLAHISSDDRLLLDFVAVAEVKPEYVAKARAALGDDWERDIP